MKTDRKRQFSGKYLSRLWNVDVKHALYHREGTWYNNLRAFPGALFDSNGYIVFATESAYRASTYLRITKETNVKVGISAIPDYVKIE